MEDTTALTMFNFQQREVRITIIDGEPWWVAADVCVALDIKNVSQAVNGNEKAGDPGLDTDEKGVCNLYTPGGNQSMLCVNESGLYHLIFKSKTPGAKTFKRWVTHEVLPTLRKTGSYTIQRAIQLPAPTFKTLEEAFHAAPHCPCPTSEQIRAAILSTVQMLQPYLAPGITVMTMMKYSEPIQAYRQVYGCHGLLEVAETLTQQHLLTRTEENKAYYYTVPQVAGYLD